MSSPPPFYYLDNFRTALGWITERYCDLLAEDEQAFISEFLALPSNAQALLVRLIMRKGPHFRASKLSYPEIGDIAAAAEPLLSLSWLKTEAQLDLDELFNLLRKDELLSCFTELGAARSLKKAEQLQRLQADYADKQSFTQWSNGLDTLYTLTISPLCNRLRLLFFGNLAQEWSEFVLAELGIYRYEKVTIDRHSRGFRCRQDVDGYLHLHHCRELFETGLGCTEVMAMLGDFHSDNPHLVSRHSRLLFQLGQQLEREGELAVALSMYAQSQHAEARQRHVRTLEKLGDYSGAYALACQALAAPRNAAESQALQRSLPRLCRALGQPKPAKPDAPIISQLELHLAQANELSVEWRVQQHLHTEAAPVYYVENTLVCGLFGLLCWEAIFTPLPGAFFHPFQLGPADLHSPDFYLRREALFTNCLTSLQDGTYQQRIRSTYSAKYGTLSPFVHWAVLTPELLETALHCLAPEHLRAWFERLLEDIPANRAGMPDLIQFWPAERRYRMIEVKGPGDRLQDNQKRWLSFCAQHGMPVDVCYVRWSQSA